jgi:hypothetical protein
MVRQGHFIAVVVTFLIGCAVILVVGCAETHSESPKQQGHTEATREQTRSAKAASEEARCEGTRTYHLYFVQYRRGGQGPLRTGSAEDMKKAEKKARQDWRYGAKTHDFGVYTTNDLPGCPKGGLLKGTDKPDKLGGKDGDDEVRGLGGADDLEGGLGNDILYGGDGDDTLEMFSQGEGEDVMYGGDGNDILIGAYSLGQRDKLYCGEGKDRYLADNNDYVDSSCEKPLVGGSA